ncbi:MAG TPA: tetratricopeptide repeat protein [Ktedonobacterales bacterium]|jgi:tetratricopeptide (TPR) repeat protein
MLLYLSFGAQPPLLDASPYELAEQVIWGDLAPFAPYLDDLDPALGRAVYPDLETLGTVVIRALRRNPATRYATLKEMRISLEQIGRRLSPIVLGRTLYQNQASDREAFRKTSELAIMILKEAAANPATAAEAHSLQGRIYAFRLGNFDEGVKSFKRAIRQDPSFDSAILGLADTYSKYGRSSLAKEQIEVLVSRHPGDIQVLMSYATILYQSGDALSAVNVLHNIQQASPYFLPAYILAIQQSIRQDDLKQAETESARALARILQVIERGNLDPEQVAEVYFLQGLLQHKQGKNELALERLELALKQLPTHQQSHKLLAKLYAERGIRDKFLYHLWASLEATSDAGGMERRPPS